MIELGESPNTIAYTALISGYRLLVQMKEAADVLETMMARVCEPSSPSYSILIHGYCKKERVDDALHLFCEISRKGLEPVVVTYSTLIQGLFQASRCTDARKLAIEMNAEGKVPNTFSRNIMITGLCNNRLTEKSLSLYQMENDCINLNITGYNTVINGLCRDSKLDVARDLFSKLPSRGFPPDVVTYTSMIHGCAHLTVCFTMLLFRNS